MIQAACHQ